MQLRTNALRQAAAGTVSAPRGLANVALPIRRARRGPLSVRAQQADQATADVAAPAAEAAQAVEQVPEATYQVPQPYQAPYGQAPYQQIPYQQPQYYMQNPNGPPSYPVPPMYAPAPAPASGGIPWWVWLGGGVILAQVIGKVQELVKKGPQQMMAEAMMKQMMSGMGGAGAAGGTPNPFAPGGGMPFGAPGAGAPGSPFAGFAQQAAAAATSTVDTTVVNGSSSRPGDKFTTRKAEETKPQATPAAAAAAPAAAAASAAAAPSGLPVVEPEVKEPSSSSSSSSAGSAPKSSAFSFTDVDATTVNGTGSTAGSSGDSAAGPGGPAGDGMMTSMLENMLRNPQMQTMLYPYLPEPMRNPQSIEWMLSNPEVKKQMEQMFAQSGMSMSPQMMDMMKTMDFSQDKVNQQFAELGLNPQDVISKVMANPELASGFSNPKVQAAIMDISQNPMNITKYQGDPEVMKVLEKVTEIFSPQMQQAQQ